jgi:hypothetical protein
MSPGYLLVVGLICLCVVAIVAICFGQGFRGRLGRDSVELNVVPAGGRRKRQRKGNDDQGAGHDG